MAPLCLLMSQLLLCLSSRRSCGTSFHTPLRRHRHHLINLCVCGLNPWLLMIFICFFLSFGRHSLHVPWSHVCFFFVYAPYKLNAVKQDFKSSEFMQLRRWGRAATMSSDAIRVDAQLKSQNKKQKRQNHWGTDCHKILRLSTAASCFLLFCLVLKILGNCCLTAPWLSVTFQGPGISVRHLHDGFPSFGLQFKGMQVGLRFKVEERFKQTTTLMQWQDIKQM